jgi:hypothetical protein
LTYDLTNTSLCTACDPYFTYNSTVNTCSF